jgi:hypothetical protein
MWSIIFATASSLLAAEASGSDATGELLREHKAICSEVSNITRAQRIALQRGWKPIADDVATRTGRALAERRGEFGPTLGGMTVTKAFLLGRVVSGRTIELMLVDESYPEEGAFKRKRLCEMHDYDVVSPVPLKVAIGAFGREPTSSYDSLTAGVEWKPGVAGRNSVTNLEFNSGRQGIDSGVTVLSEIWDLRS